MNGPETLNESAFARDMLRTECLPAGDHGGNSGNDEQDVGDAADGTAHSNCLEATPLRIGHNAAATVF